MFTVRQHLRAIKSALFGAWLLVGSPVLACPPPTSPLPSWNMQVEQAFNASDAIALVTITRQNEMPGKYGEKITRSYIRPVVVYKGSAGRLPKSLDKTTIDCDQRPSATVGEALLVFSVKGREVLRATSWMDRLAESLGSKEGLSLARSSTLRSGRHRVSARPWPCSSCRLTRSIERTSSGKLRLPAIAADVER
jgi:hypothetical protein